MDELSSAGQESAETDKVAGLSGLLEQAIICLEDLGEDYSTACQDLQLIGERLSAGRFHLAILGQFKRGKSTLLNALLGDELLPTDILPVTAIPTFIRFGSEVGGAVYYYDRSEPEEINASTERSLLSFLNEYVTEAGNPHNRLKVSRVEISYPAPLLEQGVVLIDTPGVGSTLKHNTEVAHQILPQCDAALFLVSPDPPITEMELDYLQQIKQQLPRTFYLLNKVDFLDEQEKKASLRFLSDQLSRFYASAPQVLPISARKGLQARQSGDETGWRKSGMRLVEKNLIDFFAREKKQILQQALQQRAAGLLDGACMQLQLSLKALKLPEEELKQRLEQFRQSLPAVERERQAADDVLAGDLKRALTKLSVEVEQVREDAKRQIISRVEELLEVVEDPEQLERQVRDTVAAEFGQFFAPALNRVSDVVRREATELLSLNQQRSDKLIEQVRQTSAELFEIPYKAPTAVAAYVAFEAPAWSSDLFTSDMDPLGQKLSRKLFSKNYRRRRTVRRLREESRKLLNQNVAQIDWALRKSLDESFRQFAAALHEQLDKTIAATRKAMEIALERSELHSHETAGPEVTYQQAFQSLAGVRSKLSEIIDI